MIMAKHSVQGSIKRWIAIALLGCCSPPLSSALALDMSSLPPPNPPMCAQEHQQWIQEQVGTLQQQWGHDMSQQNFRQAVRTLMALVQTISTLDKSTQSVYLTQLLLDESAQEHRWWQQLVNQAAEVELGLLTPALSAIEPLVQSLGNDQVSSKTRLLTALAATHLQLQQRQAAEQLLHLAQHNSHLHLNQTEALVPLAEAYLQLGHSEQAIAILDQAQAVSDKQGQALIQLAIAYAKAEQGDVALHLTQQIENEYEQGMAQLEVVQAYLRAERSTEALHVAQNMTEASLRATAIAIVADYYTTRHPERAAALFAEAIELAPDSSTALSEVIHRYATWRPEAALPIVRSHLNAEFKLKALGHIGRIHEQSNLDQANLVIDEMIATLPEISPDWQTHAVQELVEQAIAAGAYQQATRLVIAFENPYYFYDRASVLSNIASQAIQQKNDTAADQAIAGIMTFDLETRSRSLQQVAIAYVRVDQVDRALSWVNTFDQHELYSVPVMAAIAAEVYRIGGIDPATPLFNQALQAARELPQPEEQILALAAIASAYAQTGQSTQAHELIDEIERILPAIAEPFAASELLHRIIEPFEAQAQYEIALRVAQKIPTPTQRDHKLQGLIQRAIVAGQSEMVLPIIPQLNTPEAQAQFLLSISDRYRSLEQHNRAMDLLAQALQVTRTIPDPESRVLIFGAEGGTVVEDEFDRASFLEKIALRYAQQGQPDHAAQVSRHIQDPTLRDRLTQRLECWKLFEH